MLEVQGGDMWQAALSLSTMASTISAQEARCGDKGEEEESVYLHYCQAISEEVDQDRRRAKIRGLAPGLRSCSLTGLFCHGLTTSVWAGAARAVGKSSITEFTQVYVYHLP